MRISEFFSSILLIMFIMSLFNILVYMCSVSKEHILIHIYNKFSGL
jgi:hypothetical protein